MKNAFVLTSLIVTASYPIAVVAEMIGIVPFSVRSLPAFVGVYASAGILAFAFADYFGANSTRSRKLPSASPASPAESAATTSHGAIALAAR